MLRCGGNRVGDYARSNRAGGAARSLPHAGFHALQLFCTADSQIVLVRLQALHQPPAARLNILAKPLNIGPAIGEPLLRLLLCLRCQPRYREREQREAARSCDSEPTHSDSLLSIACTVFDQITRSDASTS